MVLTAEVLKSQMIRHMESYKRQGEYNADYLAGFTNTMTDIILNFEVNQLIAPKESEQLFSTLDSLLEML